MFERFEGTIDDELRAKPQGSRGFTKTEWERKSVFSVRAMAVECLLKALWARDGNAFVVAGQFAGIRKDESHRLHVIARDVAANAASKHTTCDFTERDLQLL